MGTDTALGDPERARGTRVLLRLTNALCELGCMEDAQGRLHFAMVLGDLLGAQVDLRGVKQREDVVLMVRAALSAADGERVLVEVVRILEGDLAGDELDRMLDELLGAPHAGQSAPDLLAGPAVSREDERAARAVLARGELPATRLRDALVEQLNGLDLPTGLSPDQLFSHVLGWNAQLDGLPPAVLLVDRAAALAATPAHRAALT
ncbi:hypothetical protein GTW38_31150, partial [Streptomyces sp. SID7804]|nr:hypothetical protein [Streptomyces sp. SID7804]